jgi:hypothetical protein
MEGRRNQVGRPLAGHQTEDHRKVGLDHGLVVEAERNKLANLFEFWIIIGCLRDGAFLVVQVVVDRAVYHRVDPIYVSAVFVPYHRTSTHGMTAWWTSWRFTGAIMW